MRDLLATVAPPTQWFLDRSFLLVYLATVVALLGFGAHFLDSTLGNFLCVFLTVPGVILAGCAVWYQLSHQEPDSEGEELRQAIVTPTVAALVLLMGYGVYLLIVMAEASPQSFRDVNLRTFLQLTIVLGVVMLISWRSVTRAGDYSQEVRAKSTALVSLSGVPVLLAVFGWKDWDSLSMAMLVLFHVAMLGAVVLLLPSLFRRVALSFAVLFHFGGIITATTAVQLPNNAQMPYIPTQVWNHVYRPYLSFTYLNNAYHFYSPEPGPPALVWFLVKFDDGSKKWIKLVQREDFATRQQYQRMLSLTESVNQTMATPVNKLEALRVRRFAWGTAVTPFKDKEERPLFVPMSEFLNVDVQYREPTLLARKYLKSYASYVCRTTKSPTNPDAKVESVKVYRLVHHLIQPAQLDGGLSPKDPTLFWAYYQGEYTKDGDLIGNPFANIDAQKLIVWREQDNEGKIVERKEESPDPFLYWMLPIIRVPKPGIDNPTKLNHYILIDSLSIHAHPGEYLEWELD